MTARAICTTLCSAFAWPQAGHTTGYSYREQTPAAAANDVQCQTLCTPLRSLQLFSRHPVASHIVVPLPPSIAVFVASPRPLLREAVIAPITASAMNRPGTATEWNATAVSLSAPSSPTSRGPIPSNRSLQRASSPAPVRLMPSAACHLSTSQASPHRNTLPGFV